MNFRSKEGGTRVKGHSRSIFRAAKTENPVPRRSSVFLCSETTRKRLPRRLLRQKMVTENRYFQLPRRLKYRYISFKILLWIILTAKMSSFLLITWVIMYVKSADGFLCSLRTKN